MPNNKEVKTNRDRYAERLRSKYPDREFADDEAIFGQANDDYDNYDRELSEYQERESSLSNLFTSDPRSAAFLMDWRNGEDPVVGMIRKFGDDFKAALEDPEKQEALAAASKEYAERVSKEKDFEMQYQKNIKETLASIEELQQEEGISDDEIDDIMEFLTGIMKDGILGKYSKESIMMARNAINHDTDVELADREGEVRGRNAKIEEKLRRKGRSDGTANLAGKNGVPSSRPDLGALNNYGTGSKNIWERGNEKRTKIN